MKRMLKKTLILTLVMTMLIGLFAINANAATQKSVKAQNMVFMTRVIEKKATTVKKGTTDLSFNGSGYVKFVAPATKTYTFTVSNIRSSNVVYTVMRMQKKTSGLFSTRSEVIPLTRGKKDMLPISTNYGRNLYKYFRNSSSIIGPSSRKITIKLKKGQVVYMNLTGLFSGRFKAKLVIN